MNSLNHHLNEITINMLQTKIIQNRTFLETKNIIIYET